MGEDRAYLLDAAEAPVVGVGEVEDLLERLGNRHHAITLLLLLLFLAILLHTPPQDQACGHPATQTERRSSAKLRTGSERADGPVSGGHTQKYRSEEQEPHRS